MHKTPISTVDRAMSDYRNAQLDHALAACRFWQWVSVFLALTLIVSLYEGLTCALRHCEAFVR